MKTKVKMSKMKVFVTALAVVAAANALAAVELSTPFADGMVLQRGMKVPVWGRAAADEEVVVRFAGQEKTVRAAKDGRWRVDLDPMEASKEGRVLSAGTKESPSQSVANDVLVGEVWIVSGQSNSEFPLVGYNPHFSDRQGILVAKMTHKPYIRFAYSSTYKSSAEPRAEHRERTKWLKFIPENLLQPKRLSAMGAYFALDLYSEIDVPVGLICAYWGGTNIEPWIPREAFSGVVGAEWCRDWKPVSDKKDLMKVGYCTTVARQPSVLWNDMLAPWCPMAVRGAIWYQGCSNSSRAKGRSDWYRRMMHALYGGWSRSFENPALKFYFVELAPFDNWWDVQMCQARFAAEEPNAAMVPTCDVGSVLDIHPNEKGTVGKRLAALALKRDYGVKDIVADAPVLKRCVADGRNVKMTFSDASSWWMYSEDWSIDVPFEVAGVDGKWRPARLVNSVNGLTNSAPWKTKGNVDGGGELVVCAEGVERPVAVRHLYRKPWKGVLYSVDSGLPLGPFEAMTAGPADDVNCFIGTGGDGHCFPAAAYPFGLVQAGPDTGIYCSGYAYEDSQITMFSHTHNPGGGCPDYADIGIMPFVGDATNVVSTFSHANEKASPGYYAVTLDRGGIEVEVSATEHAAMYRIHPDVPRTMKLLVDLDYGMGNKTWAKKTVKPIKVELTDNGGIRAHLLRNGFVKNRNIGVDICFSLKPKSVDELPHEGEGVHAPRYVVTFDLPLGVPLLVKCALSTTDGEGAARNLEKEIPDWDFDAVRLAVRAKWNDILSRISAECPDRDSAVQFATAVYHMFLVPTNITDVDGRYRGGDGKIAESKTGRYYSELSLWDTFRGAHPLYTIAAPEYVPHFVNAMLEHFDAAGYLPVLPKWGQDSQCMIATHGVAVIADAFFKGFGGVDWNRAFEAVKDTLTKTHPGRKKEQWDVLDKYGYYPCDLFKGEGVSRTLECSYDDWCAYKMAEALGRKEDAEFFRKRAGNWRNVFDAKTGFMRGRKADGSWREPFDPYHCGHESSWVGDFTEGNAWQWRWHVLQDPVALVEALGGREKSAALLDELFSLSSNLDAYKKSPDVTGLLGQYVQGNEPSHHIPYLYQYAGRPDRVAERIRELCDKFYANAPDGLCGNEDHGEMSAWYVFACLGFYPVNPSSGEFVIGAPQVPKVLIKLADGKSFAVVANGLSEKAKYVKSVMLNGKPVDGFILRYADIVAGGELVFEMSESKEVCR